MKSLENVNPEVNTSVDAAAAVDEVMKKYDRESNTRIYEGVPKFIVGIILAAFSVYAIYMNIFALWDSHIKKASFVGILLFLVFMLYPISKKHNKKVNHIPFYDIIIGVVGTGCFMYYVFNFNSVIRAAGRIDTVQIIIGIIGILVLMEACRRVVGIPILVVASCFIAYAFYSGLNLRTVIYTLFYTDNGVIGTPTSVCSTYIVLFIIFGSFLEATGISEFFINAANSVAGASCGGPAKVAVISSALCGMVSGSSVANTVTTGSVTIPLMKKTGYRPEFAGAVEAAASTGGQIMPPIMGAAAFLMAEFMGVPYATVAVKAILPALLYFSGIFIMVHLEAKKLGLKGLSKEDLPVFWKLIVKQGYLLLPLIILMYLVIATQAMALSAFFAIMATIAVAAFAKSKNWKFFVAKLVLIIAVTVLVAVFGIKSTLSIVVALVLSAAIVAVSTYEKNETINISAFFNALCSGAKSTLSVGIACAIAGIIAGVVTKTGLGSILISAIVSVAGDVKLIALFLTMISCIVLGMGVPTTANFVIMATTCAPILINGMGIDTVAAYMFVFYFGIVADITPPVALAAYAGSAIAGSNPMKTGVNASKLAIAAFIIPYVFALNPALLLVNTAWYEVIEIFATSMIGMFGLSAALEGYLFRKLNVIFRILCAVGGILLISPTLLTDVIGIAVIGGIFAFEFFAAKSQKNKLNAA